MEKELFSQFCRLLPPTWPFQGVGRGIRQDRELEFWGRAFHGAGERFSPVAPSVVALEGSRQEDLGRCHVVTAGHQY